MIPTRILAAYFLTWLMISLTPGPAVVCVMAQSTRYGFRSSLRGLAGLQSVSVFFFLCIALGLGTLLAKSTYAFTIIRGAGALYLLYLGAKFILSSFRQAVPATRSAAPKTQALADHRGLYLQGILVQITNPKALLFMGAILPQFIDPQHLYLQLGILLIPTIALDSVIQASYAYLAQRGIRSFRSSRFSAWLERALGATLIYFGLRMLMESK